MFRLMVNLISRKVMKVESYANRFPIISTKCVSQVKRQMHLTKPDSGNCNLSEQNYQNAISTLNTLQSNYSVLQDSVTRKHQDESMHITATQKFLERISIPLSLLDQLPVIHVSGTKGKGSTCAMVESILRSNGYRTGFFSSPHLVTVTERIRLNGVPIANERFAEHFWKIYNRLVATRDHESDLPSYFCFLTIMALDVFLREMVDVCVIEVGVGGRYDSTNVLRNTKTVGITSLGLEHTKLLGDTLEEIAWQKAGIVKKGCDVFTTTQPANCLEVIQRECDKMEAKLHITPSRLDEYDWGTQTSLTNQQFAPLECNTSLAIQIACNWIQRTRPNGTSLNPLVITKSIADGIDSCFWPGRLQTVPCGGLRTLYLDGAHTVESMDICTRWFSAKQLSHHNKLLIFNTTGDRNSFQLLSTLSQAIKFDAVFFTPNIAFSQGTQADTVNHNFPIEQQLQRSRQNCAFWKQLGNSNGIVHDSIESVFKQIDNNYPLGSHHPCDILTTGSIHLLGATLTALKLEKYAYSAT